MPSVNTPVPPECPSGHPLSDPRAIHVVQGKYWYCRLCNNAYHRERKRELRAAKPAKKRKESAPAERTCLWCGKPIRGSSEREKWCPTGCYRAWYIAQTGYQLSYQNVK